ncbi:PepSY-like domain-containing protein [Tellurirhabdus rosea]|uniref:PepSY-like domain-containing protein n=1 Tax=Tellurirhabdus rosea TaxID=2674997 RepID=UPI00224F03FE|nr:PepSY-like domain-containing protein [Tellurirhabdus rosea]
MKKIGYTLALLAALGLSSCQKEIQPVDGVPITDPNASVPTAVVRAVQEAYPSASGITFTELDKGKVWESRFKVAAVNHQAMVNEKGTILQAYAVREAATGMPTDTIAPAIVTYIRTHYPDYTVAASGAGQFNNQPSFKVLLRKETQEITLIFDAKGAVLFEHKGTAQTGPVEPPKTYPISQADELPASVSQYLKENGFTFARGLVTVGADNAKVYLLVVSKGSVFFELTIDASGKFPSIRYYTSPTAPPSDLVQKSIGSDKELPAVVTAYLNENYKGWVFMKGYVNSVSDKPVEHMVVVQVGSVYWYVSFNGEGKFVSAQKGS